MKIINKFGIFILITLNLLLPLPIQALEVDSPSINSMYSGYSYVIDSYHIDVNVNLNNTFDITEYITAYFNIPKHGIYRTIPLRNKINRLDGTSSINRTKITNLSVNNDYSTLYEDNSYKIKIGSSSTTFTGKQEYVIKYTYNIGKDPVKDYDELYLNLIGTDWDTVIGNISFTINMPKEFDSSKLGFSSGSYGSTNNSNITYTVNGNTINGRYNGVLMAHSALTIRCELDEGYFVGAQFEIPKYAYLMVIVPILSLIISIYLWRKYGRDDKIVETVEFYPPAGLNSLDVGFLYKGYAVNKDVTSLLVYLANKGYIKIIESDKKKKFSKANDFKLIKLKDYDGNDVHEKVFLAGLFKKTNANGEVTSKQLENKFYKTMNKILSSTNSKTNQGKILDKKTSGKRFIMILLFILSLILVVGIPSFDYEGTDGLFMALVICLIYVPFFAIGIFANMSILFRILWLGFISAHCMTFLTSLPIADVIISDSTYLVFTIIGAICLLGIIICFKFIPRRTPYGNEMLGKLRGFKRYLKTAEKAKLEAMVNENPTYFYDILPYAYVLGVSNKWIKKFESISVQEPIWYDSQNAFDIVYFSNFMDSTLSSASNSMSSSPYSSSDISSFSGGGSSGGGSGGGGGGSW